MYNICKVITYSRVWINRVRLPILFVVSWTGKMNISQSPFEPKNLFWRDGFGRPVPRQSATAILHTQPGSGAYSRDSFRFTRRRRFIYLNRHTPSGQPRVYRVTQLHTDVHCRGSVGTGSKVLKVVPVTGAAFASPFFFSFFNLTYSRWASSLPSCLWSLRIFPSLPGSRLKIFLSRCKFSIGSVNADRSFLTPTIGIKWAFCNSVDTTPNSITHSLNSRLLKETISRGGV